MEKEIVKDFKFFRVAISPEFFPSFLFGFLLATNTQNLVSVLDVNKQRTKEVLNLGNL
jgi:hypothetical protein